ncbi:MAG: redoxin domain-containing protein [Anaerolineae bacterium]
MTQPTSSAPQPGKPSPILIVFLVIPLLGLLAALALALSENNSVSQAVPTPLPVNDPFQQISLIDQPAPNFELTGLDGARYRLSNYRGRVVFLNFWATWCEPCKRELPALQQFVAEQGDQGAVVLALNMAEKPEAINTYFNENNISGLTVLLDDNLEVKDAFAIDVFPTTYVIDRGGVVREKKLGEITLTDLKAYMTKLAG